VSRHIERNLTMSEQARFNSPSRNTPTAETNRSEQQRQFENYVESRLNDFRKLVASFIDAPYPSLLREKEAIRHTLEELIVKEEALRWIVRVARHSEGTVREALWLDIEKALGDLGNIAEGLRHAGE
jgi:hypothetical protein